jgi:hypothetical protein
MSATEKRSGPVLRKLPASARRAMANKAAAVHAGEVARDQFARTFEDVLSNRFGGRWSVEWKRADRSLPAANGDRRTFSGKK